MKTYKLVCRAELFPLVVNIVLPYNITWRLVHKDYGGYHIKFCEATISCALFTLLCLQYDPALTRSAYLRILQSVVPEHGVVLVFVDEKYRLLGEDYA